MIRADQVKKIIGKHLLADGMDIIIDLEKSHGSWLVDKRNGDRYLDCFSMFASMAVGFNHPKLVAKQDYFGAIAIQKPANSDTYSGPMAEFLDTFSKIAIPPYLPHAFFIEGGALAVENSLKAAIDWKVKKNFLRGEKYEQGHKIIHFQQAFHGRSGYTLSLTNTADPRKTGLFPKFDWPRVTNPKLSFPTDDEILQLVKNSEKKAVEQIKRHLHREKENIAAIIIEPIQGEGGDNHFRNEFFIKLRQLADENELLLIFDEVQTGLGLTGKFWAHEHFSINPDLICFGKKTQVCGVLGGPKLDEIEDNVFAESSRINSTFGGNLIDMVRCSEILKVIDQEKLIENASERGKELLKGLQRLSENFPKTIFNPRGRGLMCAFDLASGQIRDELLSRLLEEKLLLVGCGESSVRFRPHLVINKQEIQLVLDILNKTVKSIS